MNWKEFVAIVVATLGAVVIFGGLIMHGFNEAEGNRHKGERAVDTCVEAGYAGAVSANGGFVCVGGE